MSDASNTSYKNTGSQPSNTTPADTASSQASGGTTSSPDQTGSRRVQLALNYKDPDVLITVEEKNGDLLFIVELTKGPSNLADLRALFFNVSDSSLLSGLTVANHAITVRDKGSDKVIVSDIKDVKVAKGDGTVVKVGDTGSANINGEGESHTADFGIEFGTPGDGKDDVRIGTFILSHEEDLTLDLIDRSSSLFD